MKITKTILQCDCCGKELHKRDYIKNDGSYQQDFISVENKDICFSCGGKILEIFFLKEDSKKILNAINDFKNKTSPLSMRHNVEKVDFSFLNTDKK